MNSLKITALAALLAAGSAMAQTTTPADPQNDAIAPAATPQKSLSVPEFKSLDINGDGKVSEQEAQANSAVWERFTALDTDKNGSLSTNEYAKAKNSDKHLEKQSDKY